MNPDVLITKYLLSEGVKLAQSNVYVDNSLVVEKTKEIDKLLAKSVILRGQITKYENPYTFEFLTLLGQKVYVTSKESIHLQEGKYTSIIVNNVKDSHFLHLLYYDRV